MFNISKARLFTLRLFALVVISVLVASWILSSSDRILLANSDPLAKSSQMGTPNAGPTLTVAADLTTAAGGTVTVPIAFAADGNDIAGIGLSIDFDETCLGFDDTDSDGNAIPDSIVFDMSPQFFPSVSYDPTDPDGELDFILADYSPPLATLEDTDALISITFTATCQPATEAGQNAAVNFSDQPSVSFSDPTGRSVSGESVPGTVLILPSEAFTPEPTVVTATPTPIDIATPSQTVTVTVTATVTPDATSTPDPEPVGNNQVPTVGNDSATTNEDTSINIQVLQNDSDPDGDALQILAVDPPASGSTTLNSDNTITYVPQLDYSGLDSFTYTISDDRGGTISATVRVTIRAVNDAPALLIAPSSQTHQSGDEVTLIVSANDVDTAQDELIYTATDLPSGISIDAASGQISGTLTDDSAGSYSVTLMVSDGSLSDSVQFEWTVESTNRFIYIPLIP